MGDTRVIFAGDAEPSTKARKADPKTSHVAGHAQRAEKLRASQARVLSMFRLYGDMTDQSLLAYLNDAEKLAGMRPMSPSGTRSRRSELSKPNMDRLRVLRSQWYREHDVKLDGVLTIPVHAVVTDVEEAAIPKVQRDAADEWSRRTLRIEADTDGFRSPLWDTGRREKSHSGYPMIVWGIAR